MNFQVYPRFYHPLWRIWNFILLLSLPCNISCNTLCITRYFIIVPPAKKWLPRTHKNANTTLWELGSQHPTPYHFSSNLIWDSKQNVQGVHLLCQLQDNITWLYNPSYNFRTNLQPLFNIIEGLLVGHVIHHDNTVGPPVVAGGDGAEPLLSRCVPNL